MNVERGREEEEEAKVTKIKPVDGAMREPHGGLWKRTIREEECRFDRRVVFFKQSAVGIKFQEVAEMEGREMARAWCGAVVGIRGKKGSGSGSDGRWSAQL